MSSVKIHFIHLVAGEIGGVGKSFFCKMLIEAFQFMNLAHWIIDCDETTPNVGRTYDPSNYDPAKIAEYHAKVATIEKELQPLVQKVIDAETTLIEAPDILKAAQNHYNLVEDGASSAAVVTAQAALNSAPENLKQAKVNLAQARKAKYPIPLLPRIYFIGETADEQELPNKLLTLAQKNNLIVNLPAQVTKTVNRWIQDSDLLEGVKEDGVETICWFVAKPTKASIEQLRDLYNFHKGKLQVVLVKNNYTGHGGNWDDVIDPLIKAWLKSSNIRTIEMENLRLSDDARSIIDGQYPILSELTQEGDDRVPYDVRKKLSKYLRVMIEAIVTTGLLLGAEVPIETPVKSAKKATSKKPIIDPAELPIETPVVNSEEQKND